MGAGGGGGEGGGSLDLEIRWNEGTSDSRVHEDEVPKGLRLNPAGIHEPPNGAPVIAFHGVPLHPHSSRGGLHNLLQLLRMRCALG